MVFVVSVWWWWAGCAGSVWTSVVLIWVVVVFVGPCGIRGSVVFVVLVGRLSWLVW